MKKAFVGIVHTVLALCLIMPITFASSASARLAYMNNTSTIANRSDHEEHKNISLEPSNRWEYDVTPREGTGLFVITENPNPVELQISSTFEHTDHTFSIVNYSVAPNSTIEMDTCVEFGEPLGWQVIKIWAHADMDFTFSWEYKSDEPLINIDPRWGLPGIPVTITASDPVFGKSRGNSTVSFAPFMEEWDKETTEYIYWSETMVQVRVPDLPIGEEDPYKVKISIGYKNYEDFFYVRYPGYNSHQYYFAEGCTRDGFEEWLSLYNPADKSIIVNAIYMLFSGDPIEISYEIRSTSRLSVFVNGEIGPGHDVSVELKSDDIFYAERPIYFNYKQGQQGYSWSGGHCAKGAVSPSTIWYFAEGTTRDGFEEWLCIQNPNDLEATLKVRFLKTDSTWQDEEYTVGAQSRWTLDVNELLGPGFDTSIVLESDQPVIAERPMYFNYHGWTGGHNVVGTPWASCDWVLAEGCTHYGFDEYICLANPGDDNTTVNIKFMPKSGNPIEKDVEVGSRQRATVKVSDVIGLGREASAVLISDKPIVVERPTYFSYGAGWDGGHNVMGSYWYLLWPAGTRPI